MNYDGAKRQYYCSICRGEADAIEVELVELERLKDGTRLEVDRVYLECPTCSHHIAASIDVPPGTA